MMSTNSADPEELGRLLSNGKRITVPIEIVLVTLYILGNGFVTIESFISMRRIRKGSCSTIL